VLWKFDAFLNPNGFDVLIMFLNALLISLSQYPSHVYPSSLLLLLLCTMTLHSHLCKLCRSGLFLLNALNDIFLSNAQVDIQFLNQMACFKALSYRDPSKLAVYNIAYAFSNSIHFSCSAILLCSRLL